MHLGANKRMNLSRSVCSSWLWRLSWRQNLLICNKIKGNIGNNENNFDEELRYINLHMQVYHGSSYELISTGRARNFCCTFWAVMGQNIVWKICVRVSFRYWFISAIIGSVATNYGLQRENTVEHLPGSFSALVDRMGSWNQWCKEYYIRLGDVLNMPLQIEKHIVIRFS